MSGKFRSIFYAELLLETVKDGNELRQIKDELGFFSDLLHADRDLMIYLNSPGISRDSKKRFINRVFSEEFSDGFVNFINLLIENDCQSSINEIHKIIASEDLL